MPNELASADAPMLHPPESASLNNEGYHTPDSISSSIVNYSPITPSVAHKEQYAYGTSMSEVTKVTADTDADLDDNDTTRVTESISVNTFSSDENNDNSNENTYLNIHNPSTEADEEELFEHFNGSSKDLVDSFSSNPRQTPKREPITNSPLNITKLREEIDHSIEDKEAQNRIKYNTMTRKITPISKEHTNAEQHLRLKVLESERQFAEFDTKAFKIEREITYVDKLLKELNYEDFRAKDQLPVQIQKLLYAREKLMDRLLTAKKTKYDLGVTLSKLRRKLYGDNSGDMTGYFARNVSQ